MAVVVPEITPKPRDDEAGETVESAAPPAEATTDEPAQVASSAEAPAEVAPDSLPVPVSEPPKRRSLWRRLTRRREGRGGESSGFQDLVKSRLDGITLRLESFEHGLARSEARLDSRFAVLESLEQRLEELADLGERVDQAQAAARQAAGAARDAARTARVAAILASLAILVAGGTLIRTLL